MAEEIDEGISKLRLSKADSCGDDVTSITHGMSKISTKSKDDGISDKSCPIRDEVDELKSQVPAPGNNEVARWKMDKEAYPKFQGGRAKSLFSYTWPSLNFRQLIDGPEASSERDYFFPEYGFHFRLRLSQGSPGYVMLTLRFLKKITKKEVVKTKKKRKKTKIISETEIIETEILETEFEEREIESKPLVPCIYIVIKASNRVPRLVRWFQCDYGECYEYGQTYRNSIHLGKLERSLGKTNGGTDIKIYVEQPSMSTRAFSHDGVLIWSVEHYRRRKEEQTKEMSEGELSPYFYTDPRGYRVQAVVILEKSLRRLTKDVCVEIHFLNGLHDEWLMDYYDHRTTVSVVRKRKPGEKMTKSVEKNLKDENSYVIEIGSYEEVEQYVDEDTLCYTVVIEGLATGASRKRKRARSAEDI